jgi:leader peptidase (prepilin peptidase)/N-methyltransferase
VDPAPAIALTITLAISSVTDIGRRRIPNLLTGPAAVVALLLAALGLSVGPLESVIVALTLVFPLAALAILRPEGFGMGDVKLIGVMALFLGWEVWLPLLGGLGAATLAGTIIALGRGGAGRSVALPLAPFLAAGMVPSLAAALPLLH